MINVNLPIKILFACKVIKIALKKGKKTISIIFNKIFNNKISEEILKFFIDNFNQNNFDQELNIEVDTNQDLHSSKSVLQI